jgi:hypothetical protein
LDMKGVNLIPGFAVLSRHIFECRKCGHSETVFREGETAWKISSIGKT